MLTQELFFFHFILIKMEVGFQDGIHLDIWGNIKVQYRVSWIILQELSPQNIMN
ncbi:hypothetical protein GXY_06188 [Novacetimonas hansenii ATCC 23769]|uniref:Uncharacterized protein n=1 Tax=Novacetimonas hansenii ATCC 23769 TaxID=714995 RepID=D5QDM7_NOVHA|nr:hypothetical protein GXY_06188 [Novacetimonas hansenii ATCC 23769]